MREFVSPPQNHVWEMNQKIQKIEQNLNTLIANQDIPLKLKKVEDHKYELYVDLNKDQLLQLKNNPNSSIMGIPRDLSSLATSVESPDNTIFYTKYSYMDDVIMQQIQIDYSRPSISLLYHIMRYRPNYIFNIDIQDYDYEVNSNILFNNFKHWMLPAILQYFGIEDEQASITNLDLIDLTTEGTYIIKTGSTLHTIPNLDKSIKFPAGETPTFEVNKTYILKVTYDNDSDTYYCTDVKSYSNT